MMGVTCLANQPSMANLTYSNILKRSWADIDFVALQLIIEMALPPVGLLNPCLSFGPDSLWCRYIRAKKNLTLVSRHWRVAAIPFLYREIVLRRVTEVLAFAQMCITHPEHCSLAQTIQIMCYVPQTMRKAYTESVLAILEHCGRVTSLTFGPTFVGATFSDIGCSGSAYDYELCDVIRKIGSRLHTLRIYDSIDFNRPRSRKTAYSVGFLNAFPHLRRLAIPLVPANYRGIVPRNTWMHKYSNLRLNCLEEITINVYHVGAEFDVMSNWVLPALKRVTLDSDNRSCIPGVNRPHGQQLVAFFRSHGPKVKELDLRCTYLIRPWSDEDAFGRIIGLCTSLQYVALAPSVLARLEGLRDALKEDHKSDAPIYIDIWQDRNLDRDWTFIHPSRFRTTRIVTASLIHLPNITRFFPPGQTGTVSHDFIGLQVEDTTCGAVMRVLRLQDEAFGGMQAASISSQSDSMESSLWNSDSDSPDYAENISDSGESELDSDVDEELEDHEKEDLFRESGLTVTLPEQE
ncbi:hypothetical protein BXZ70DRAFT_666516 [Cristinia sonorae]|uniref:Uncharacterized protein n=1 Tax=Cristinia sonorae TaxID=1940300 RepID=A0A8K0UTH3_9AGAR|nr:hypothetical protein BXZ70DRAFT_666516 [Cristinia sonorae]